MPLGDMWPIANLVGLWPLESSSADASNQGNSGTDTSITYAGRDGGRFNGTTSKITFVDGAQLKPTNSFSMGGWLRKTTANSTRGVVQSHYSENAPNTNAGVFMDVDQNPGEIALNIGYGSSFTRFFSTPTVNYPTDGKWHHFVSTYNGSTVNLYWDGLNINSTAMTNLPTYSATTYHRLGDNSATGAEQLFFGGSLRMQFLFNGTVLTPEYIRKYYNWSLGRFTGLI